MATARLHQSQLLPTDQILFFSSSNLTAAYLTNREDDETINTEITLENYNYRAIVGSLQYLAITLRPDIFYAVNFLSCHQVNPYKKNGNWLNAFLDT